MAKEYVLGKYQLKEIGIFEPGERDQKEKEVQRNINEANRALFVYARKNGLHNLIHLKVELNLEFILDEEGGDDEDVADSSSYTFNLPYSGKDEKEFLQRINDMEEILRGNGLRDIKSQSGFYLDPISFRRYASSNSDKEVMPEDWEESP